MADEEKKAKMEGSWMSEDARNRGPHPNLRFYTTTSSNNDPQTNSYENSTRDAIDATRRAREQYYNQQKSYRDHRQAEIEAGQSFHEPTLLRGRPLYVTAPPAKLTTSSRDSSPWLRPPTTTKEEFVRKVPESGRKKSARPLHSTIGAVRTYTENSTEETNVNKDGAKSSREDERSEEKKIHCRGRVRMLQSVAQLPLLQLPQSETKKDGCDSDKKTEDGKKPKKFEDELEWEMVDETNNAVEAYQEVIEGGQSAPNGAKARGKGWFGF